jgi:hypothetical protein
MKPLERKSEKSQMISRRASLVEHSVTLKIEQLRKAGALIPGLPTSGQLHWTFETGQLGSANFEAVLATKDGYLQLDLQIPSCSAKQRISLTTTNLYFGGARWWFVCPVTLERVGRLHLLAGASQFLSRRAHGLTYACQTEDVYDRAARRSRKLMMRLGADAGSRWIPLKPKGMRWTTYVRHANEIKYLEGISDGRWQKLLAKLDRCRG